MKFLLVVISLIIFRPEIGFANPEKTAIEFIQSLISGDKHSAVELVTAKDRTGTEPLGRFQRLYSSKSFFPSLWEVKHHNTQIVGDHATVSINVWYPEIERLLESRGANIVTQKFLSEYLAGTVEKIAESVSVEVVQETSGLWKVSTKAERHQWFKASKYPPKVDIANPNPQEIVSYGQGLLLQYPNRVEEIEKLTAPLIATAVVAQKAHFSNQRIDLNTTDYRDDVYEVKFTYENKSNVTVKYLKVSIVGLNAHGDIVEHDDDQVFYSGSLPSGIAPGKKIVETFHLSRSNDDQEAVSVKISVLKIEVK